MNFLKNRILLLETLGLILFSIPILLFLYVLSIGLTGFEVQHSGFLLNLIFIPVEFFTQFNFYFNSAYRFIYFLLFLFFYGVFFFLPIMGFAWYKKKLTHIFLHFALMVAVMTHILFFIYVYLNAGNFWV